MGDLKDHGAGKAWFLGMSAGDIHPCASPDGWPEFEITLSFYVSSDDPEVVKRERRRVWEGLPDAVLGISDAS